MSVAVRLGQNETIVYNACSGGLFIGVKDDGSLNNCAVTVDN